MKLVYPLSRIYINTLIHGKMIHIYIGQINQSIIPKNVAEGEL